MTSDQDLVVATVRDILADHEPFVLGPERPWDPGLWSALAGAGLTGVGLPEEAGGSGGELADAVAIVRTLAAGAAAVPVAEQLLVAGPALVAAGLDLPSPDRPLTVALSGGVSAHAVEAADGAARFRLTGTVGDVPWAGVASYAVVLAAPQPGREGATLALADLHGVDVRPGANLAGEPRGSLTFQGTSARGAVLSARQAQELRARFALARAVELAAAMEMVLAWTVQYAGERHQFGRALSRFQAVQMHLARMAGEVTAVSALADAAVQVLERGDDPVLAAAAAKVRAGEAVATVAGLAHQVHGAIGFTQEHRLHHLTRRCWAWRDEAGSELAWSQVLGAGLLGDSPDRLWPALTAVG